MKKVVSFLAVIGIIILAVLLINNKQKESIDSKILEEQAKEYYQQRENEIAKEKNEKEEKIEQEKSLRREAAFDIGLDEKQGNKVFDEKQIEISNSYSYECIYKIKNTYGVIVIEGKAKEQASILSYQNGDIEHTFWMSVQNQKIYIPIENNIDENKVVLTSDNEIVVSKIEVYEFEQCSDITMIKSGIWLKDTYDKVEIDVNNHFTENGSNACICKDNYLYLAEENKIIVYDKSNAIPEKITELPDIYCTREMTFSDDKNFIFVSARESGIYIIDISNPIEPKLAQQFDTLELATGIYVDKNYLYVCSRYFGVEIYNISNVLNPVLCSVVRGGFEYQKCYVSNNILYIAIFNEAKIVAYDVTNPYNPMLLNKFDVDGKTYGIYVKNNLLYITTAVSNSEFPDKSSLEYGLCNGFEIIDVSDIQNPIVLSSTKLDGRFEIGMSDTFKMEVEDDILYMSHTYNGLFIYDISDVYAPKRLINISIPIYTDDKQFIFEGNTKKLYPFAREEVFPETIVDFTLCEGQLFMCGINNGLYSYENNIIHQNEHTGNNEYVPSEIINEDILESQKASIDRYCSKGNIYAVDGNRDKYFVACGIDGINVINKNLEFINKISVPGIVKDIKIINNDMLGVASSKGVFLININTGRVITEFSCVNAIDIEYANNKILVQADKVYLLEIKYDNNEYQLVENYSCNIIGLYYRNIMSGVLNNKYLCVQTNSQVLWFDTQSDICSPIDVSIDTKISEGQGYAAYNDKCLAIYQGGYVLYDPTGGKVNFDNLDLITLGEEKIQGKPYICNDKLIVSKEYDGEMWIIDISDIMHPQLIDKIKTLGSPDVVYCDENYILIPNRNYGLVRLTYKK